MDHTSISIIGYASGIAAKDKGTTQGPETLQYSPHLQQLIKEGIPLDWQTTITTPIIQDNRDTVLAGVHDLSVAVARQTEHCVQHQTPFLVVGGDHASAIGTWAGAAAALPEQERLGLIWIDAHMDSHTHDTTESGAIHGMPIAALMGHGKHELTHIMQRTPSVQPEDIVIIGVRSYESGEQALLKKLNVRIYFIEEVKKRGLSAILNEALKIVTKHTTHFGVSIDLDAIDPTDAPGVGSPTPDGIRAQALFEPLGKITQDPRFIGAEIAEFNPLHDLDQKTEKLVLDLTRAIFKRK